MQKISNATRGVLNFSQQTRSIPTDRPPQLPAVHSSSPFTLHEAMPSIPDPVTRHLNLCKPKPSPLFKTSHQAHHSIEIFVPIVASLGVLPFTCQSHFTAELSEQRFPWRHINFSFSFLYVRVPS